MADPRLEKVRESMEPPWDEVRERRVLARALARKHEEEARRARWRWPLRGVAVGGALAAAAVVLVVFPGARQLLLGEPPSVVLDDGSVAQLLTGGQVEVEKQAADGVRIAQRAGKVRYRVKKQRAGAAFVVAAKGVSVRVVGTRFTVALLPDEAVEVAVEEGRVEVSDGKDMVPLGAGEHRRAVAYVEPPPPQSVDAGEEPAPDAGVAQPAPVEPLSPKARGPESIDELFARVDRARAAGNLDEAARLLRRIARAHPTESRAVAALFTLGKLESSRARYVAAAEAFDACFARAGKGALAEDALAERASALAAAGEKVKARQSARQYLRLFPHGTHAPRMEVLAR